MSESENTMMETSCFLSLAVLGMSIIGIVFVILVAELMGTGWL